MADARGGRTLLHLNALSKEFELTISDGAALWRQEFRSGVARGPLQRVAVADAVHTNIRFVLDEQLVPGAQLGAAEVREWLDENLPDLPIVVGSIPVITHPEKVLFPDSGITKGELCAYYEAIAPLMLPHISGRPVTMERYPAGIGKKGFIQKDVSKGFPGWLERVEVEKRSAKEGGTVHYPLAGDARSLLWLANQNSITPHVWTSRVPKLHQPDLCVFDLDPSGDDPDGAAGGGAGGARPARRSSGCRRFVKTSGSKGFHIVVPLDGETDFETRLALRPRRGRGAGQAPPRAC